MSGQANTKYESRSERIPVTCCRETASSTADQAIEISAVQGKGMVGGITRELDDERTTNF
jgi:hypothetical protein